MGVLSERSNGERIFIFFGRENTRIVLRRKEQDRHGRNFLWEGREDTRAILLRGRAKNFEEPTYNHKKKRSNPQISKNNGL